MVSEGHVGQPDVAVVNSFLTLSPAMGFHHIIHESQFTGKAGYTQLISGCEVAALTHCTSGYELDNVVWYSDSTPIKLRADPEDNSNRIFLADTPSVELQYIASLATMDVQFKTYLRFRPNDQSSDDNSASSDDNSENIFVTLEVVTWSCSGSIQKASGGWPTCPDSKLIIGPSKAASAEFPHWTDTFMNILLN